MMNGAQLVAAQHRLGYVGDTPDSGPPDLDTRKAMKERLEELYVLAHAEQYRMQLMEIPMTRWAIVANGRKEYDNLVDSVGYYHHTLGVLWDNLKKLGY